MYVCMYYGTEHHTSTQYIETEVYIKNSLLLRIFLDAINT